MHKNLGFTPNIYSFIANSPQGLRVFTSINQAKLEFSIQEKEFINLTVSEIRQCKYCFAAHTAISKNAAGFTDEQILQIRKGQISFDKKLTALGKLTTPIVRKHGKVDKEIVVKFYEMGYTDAHLVDLSVAIAEISITNVIKHYGNSDRFSVSARIVIFFKCC